MAIHVATLGGLRIRRDDADLERLLSQRLRIAVFTYLAVERRAPRESVAAVFWPESSGDNARHALRQSLYHLRCELGEDWLEGRTHELSVADSVRADVHAFKTALDGGAAEAAARLYAGPFLDGVNLVDLQAWDYWVDARRAHYSRAFRRACREWVEQRRAAHDIAGAIEAAQHWVVPDPLDDEAHHALIACLADAGERTAAIRHYETYERLLEAEGLHALDATASLIERVRSDAGARPRRHASRDNGVMPDVATSHGMIEATSSGPAAASDPQRSSDPQGASSPQGSADQRRASDPQTASDSQRASDSPRSTDVRRSSDPPPHSRSLPPTLWPWRTRILASGTVALVLLLVAAWGVSLRFVLPPDLSSSEVAVLPFTVHGGDDAQYLGEGVVNLLGSALDGAAVRSVDARAVFALVAQEGGRVPDPARGRRLAARLGAGLFVLGDVVHSGDMLHVEAAVYRSDRGGAPVTRVAVSGEAERVFELVDNLAARLLAALGGASSHRLTRTAALATSSLPAFKAYLEGEAEVRAGRFERAAEAYERAVAVDSTYAAAHYRLALAREWAAIADNDVAARAAARHAERLSPRDRALLEALQSYHEGDAAVAERRYRAIVARYPDELDAWFQLGEVLFHLAPRHGRPARDSEEAWRTVLSYEPGNRGAVVHLARIAAADGRVAVLDSLLAPFAPAEVEADRRLVQVALFRAVASGDSASAGALVRVARDWEDAAVFQLAFYLTAFSHEPARLRHVVRQLMAHRGSRMLAEMHWAFAVLHLANGQMSDASRALAQASAVEAQAPSHWHRAALELARGQTLATLPLPWPDSALERMRRDVRRATLPTATDGAEADGEPVWHAETRQSLGGEGRLEALRHYTVGVLSVRLRDDAAALAASAALSRLSDSLPGDAYIRSLRTELRAHIALDDGRVDDAIRLLAGDRPEPAPGGAANIVPTIARANARWLHGEALIAAGRDADALPWFASLAMLSVPESPYRALAHLRLAGIHERLGSRADAMRHYKRAVELWRDGDEAVQPLVEEAERRRAMLMQ